MVGVRETGVGGLLVVIGAIKSQSPEFDLRLLSALPQLKIHLLGAFAKRKLSLLNLKLTALHCFDALLHLLNLRKRNLLSRLLLYPLERKR